MEKTNYHLRLIRLVSCTVAIAVALLLWHVIIGPFSPLFQIVFLSVALFIIGIPHGALDHVVQQEDARRRGRPFHLYIFLGRYVLLMLAYALAWYLFPQVSLTAFILISCWHFGETDIAARRHRPVTTTVLRMIYGICVVIWLLMAHAAEVGPVLSHLVPANSLLFKSWLHLTEQAHLLLTLSGACILISLTASLQNNFNLYRCWLGLQLLVILGGGYYLPLLPAFVLYFAGWHAVVTLFNIGRFTNQENAADQLPLGKLWLKALPFSLIAIAGLAVTGYLLRHYAPLFDPLPLLFVFLSLITLPHMEVMHGLNSRLTG